MRWGALAVKARRVSVEDWEAQLGKRMALKNLGKVLPHVPTLPLISFQYKPPQHPARQDIIQLSPYGQQLPVWIFNFSVGANSPWRCVPTNVLPPACLPPELGSVPLAIVVNGAPEDMLKAAVREGTFFTKVQVNQILDSRGLGRPERGSGKKGNVLKYDVCVHLVEALFKDSSKEEKDFMVAALMTRKQMRPEDAPEFLLKLVASLDVSEAEHFSKLKQRAADDLAVQAMKQKRATRQAARVDMEDMDVDHEPAPNRKRKEPEDAEDLRADAEPGPARPRAANARNAADLPEEQIRARRLRAPPEIMRFLPVVNGLYFRWQPSQKRAMAEFLSSERVWICSGCITQGWY